MEKEPPHDHVRLCRFQIASSPARLGRLLDDGQVCDLSAAGVDQLAPLFEVEDCVARLSSLPIGNLPSYRLDQVRLLPPVERQEVWAAGVTYLRSKAARMEESDFSATAYGRVYAAPRPELFFKAMPEKVVGAGDTVGIRRDSKWNVPEPELALVLNSRGQIAGYTIGNDMSSRDIEGENLLYLPQAKIYRRSCALGPFIRVGVSEAETRTWSVAMRISRDGAAVFDGQTSVANIKRPFAELVEHLFRSQSFPHGAVLLTGTGIVPGNDFTLRPGDLVRIEISGLGVLENRVEEV
ncbi:MAG: fumarylacetoacetate hydrolase family protein [Verrucomicrobia bacterium]|nr:fumarylacetoacetate hydrolase family protein [Verrucomicrobiota bacterium]